MSTIFAHPTAVSINGQTIGGVDQVSLSGGSTNDIGTTTLATTGYHTYRPGLSDPGDVSLSMQYLPDDVGQAELLAQRTAGTTSTLIITFSDEASLNVITTTVYVKSITVDANTNAIVMSKATLKQSGAPALS